MTKSLSLSYTFRTTFRGTFPIKAIRFGVSYHDGEWGYAPCGGEIDAEIFDRGYERERDPAEISRMKKLKQKRRLSAEAAAKESCCCIFNLTRIKYLLESNIVHVKDQTGSSAEPRNSCYVPAGGRTFLSSISFAGLAPGKVILLTRVLVMLVQLLLQSSTCLRFKAVMFC
eukprot:g9552.t1